MKCEACDGCGKVANDEDRSPWTQWANLPPGSDIAVRMGLVRPETCVECGGTGVEVERCAEVSASGQRCLRNVGHGGEHEGRDGLFSW